MKVYRVEQHCQGNWPRGCKFTKYLVADSLSFRSPPIVNYKLGAGQ